MKKIYTVFPYGKYKALTLSYDDGREEDRRLVSIFRKYGLKATFNLNSGLASEDPRRIRMDEWPELYKGFEIASHTVTHPTISRCPLSVVAEEILEDRKRLEMITGYPVRGLAYPNGSYSKYIISLLPALGISYARIVGNSDDFSIPENFLEWKATCHHNHNLLENAEAFISFAKPQYLKLRYVWGHSYEFTDNGNWNLIEKFSEMISGKDEIWYATNIEIVDYLEASKRLVFSADREMVYNPSAMTLWITVDDDPVAIPGWAPVKL